MISRKMNKSSSVIHCVVKFVIFDSDITLYDILIVGSKT